MRMGKKKDWSSLNVQSPVAVHSIIKSELLTAEEIAIRDAVAALKPITTFAAIGEQISYSRQMGFKTDAGTVQRRPDCYVAPG